MDRLDELAVLVAVLDTGSLISASRRLRRSPPAVTRALGALEARIGARLIERIILEAEVGHGAADREHQRAEQQPGSARHGRPRAANRSKASQSQR